MKVLIPENIPAHNKGEEAILRGILRTFGDIEVEKLYLYSTSPDYDQKIYGNPVEVITDTLIPYARTTKWVKIKHLLGQIPKHLLYLIMRKIDKGLPSKFFKSKLFQAYDEVDCVICAHDNAYAIMHNALILFCNFINVPVVVYGTSLKSFVYERPLAKAAFKMGLERVNLATTREALSYSIVRDKLEIRNANIHLTADKAFLVSPDDASVGRTVLEKHGLDVDKDVIVGATLVNKTDVFHGCLKSIADESEKMAARVSIYAQYFDYIVEKCGAKIAFFPHSIGPKEFHDDRVMARRVLEACKHKDQMVAIEDDLSVSTLKSMQLHCAFFTGERTHSCIGAASVLTPFLSLTYEDDHRTWGILGEMVGAKEWIYNISKMEKETLTAAFDNAWDNKKKIVAHLEERIPQVVDNSMMNGHHLKQLLSEYGLG
ncbi:polysaccharide pyruvyl transferase family protein [Pseudodesulfovibrio portus]|uniref:Polysaccharide pyruvyl transferase domain-containing protein n=1 Tax=Pseudodesulfovibrio portus TaxID=231439 RepID=A0ABN6RXR5_9BACT|nr:polysaccharide pyruvyl transferase family protein [Pseudodesulfovibrio portus]BDQ35474.1 hypothetical protein JCM14722_30160 [Pseudodesulfovibrio portus]